MPEAAETTLLAIWLPTLLVAVATMILSTLAWTALPHHKPDLREHPKADEFTQAVRQQAVEPGQYFFPSYGTPKAPSDDMKTGPWGIVNIYPAAPNMGRNIAMTFFSLAVISVFVGYLTAQSCNPGAEPLRVFQIATTAAVLCHVFGGTLNGIWFGKRLRFFITDAIDGLLYSLATGAIFAWLWPAAQSAISAS